MEDTDSLVNAGSSNMEIRKRYNTSASAEELADPDVNYQDASISSRSSMSDDEDEKVEDKDTSRSRSPRISESLQQLCGFDSTAAAEIFAMPGRALDKVEDVARHLWKLIPGLPFEKAEEIARQAWVAGPGMALDKAEEMAHMAWDIVPGFNIEKIEETARHLWQSVPGLTLESAEVLVRRAWAAVPGRALDKAEELVRQAWDAGRAVVHHHHLPAWLKDNDFLVKGHRPPLNSFWACFKSIFRIHTETGNIWTHLIGCVAFVMVAAYFLTRPSIEVNWREKAVFSAFFAGAILCLGFSCIFHTVYCHSERVGRIFGKLDYCGIALLIVGSFVPWLYYSFYCRQSPQIVYLVLIIVLGICSVVVSMWDKFGEPKYRPVRAGVFVALGLSGVFPAAHYILTEGFYHAWNFAALGWLILMAFLYIAGAAIYAARIPECIWPGKFDIWFQSHQIFHVFVVAAAFIHYHGMSEVANNRLAFGHCLDSTQSGDLSQEQ